VCSWNTGLEAICMAAWLSQNKILGVWQTKWRSASRFLSQINSYEADVIARYSASTLERATTCCFLLFQDTKFHKEHARHSLGNLTKKDLVCQFLRKLSGEPILDPWRAFKPFFDIKPREDVSHNHNYLYIHLFWLKKQNKTKERVTSAGLYISGMIAFSISHI